MAKKKREYHPPLISGIIDQPGKFPGYLKGETGLQGFGNKDFFVKLIPFALAREIITKNHYSKRIVNNSYLSLGVFLFGEIVGAMQFGYMLQPRRAHNIVEGTQIGEYLELNRMWLDDKAPRNSESRAISYAVKYIKKAMPMVAWIQSFANERCGGLGVVYQAANFLFCGSHKAEFYLLDGEYYHDMLMTLYRSKGRAQYLRDNRHRAKSLFFNQFRYIYFIKKAWQRRLLKKVQPYPKPGKSGSSLTI